MGFATQALAEKPLSAIEWLNDPAAQQSDLPQGYKFQSDVVDTVQTDAIQVTELDADTSVGIGLLPLHVAQLPADLWQDANAIKIEKQLARLSTQLLPTAKDILDRVLLAQAPSDNAILLARVNRLFDVGEVRHAFHLLQQQPITDPDIFDIFFDAALLLDHDGQACNTWDLNKSLSDEPELEIFCRAILGDWDTAVLNYFALTTLGDLSPVMSELLSGFLDPELVDELELGPTDLFQMTPLEFRLRDAIGQSIPTSGLPLPFANVDLQAVSGWRAQLDAVERLATVGSATPELLKETYLARVPAASGGVWDRVAALQILLSAIEASNIEQIQSVLPTFWEICRSNGLAASVAKVLGPIIGDLKLDGQAASVQFEIIALTQASSTIPAKLFQDIPDDLKDSIDTAFIVEVTDVPVDAPTLLNALLLTDAVQEGDLSSIPNMIKAFRSLGFEAEARSLVIEYLLLAHVS